MRPSLALICLALAPALPAFADGLPDAPDDAALHSSVGWGQTVKPELVSVTTEAGYDGAQQRTQATGQVEASLFWKLSVFAAVTYGEETTGVSRPAIGGAIQILDPRKYPVGVRVSVAYKPEGFSEPEGEVETIAMLSHLINEDVVRVFGAYGTDPDGKESDAEAGAGYLHRTTANLTLGVTSRFRYAIAVKDVGPRWDLIGGAVGDLGIGRWRLELLLGGGAVDMTGAVDGVSRGLSGGLLGLGSLGIDL